MAAQESHVGKMFELIYPLYWSAFTAPYENIKVIPAGTKIKINSLLKEPENYGVDMYEASMQEGDGPMQNIFIGKIAFDLHVKDEKAKEIVEEEVVVPVSNIPRGGKRRIHRKTRHRKMKRSNKTKRKVRR